MHREISLNIFLGELCFSNLSKGSILKSYANEHLHSYIQFYFLRYEFYTVRFNSMFEKAQISRNEIGSNGVNARS